MTIQTTETTMQAGTISTTSDAKIAAAVAHIRKVADDLEASAREPSRAPLLTEEELALIPHDEGRDALRARFGRALCACGDPVTPADVRIVSVGEGETPCRGCGEPTLGRLSGRVERAMGLGLVALATVRAGKPKVSRREVERRRLDARLTELRADRERAAR